MVNLYPTICNLCGGEVIYTTNDVIYGRKYGNGYCYLCTNCGAYVGTHEYRPKVALGLLADEPMKKGKIACHNLFDKHWKGKKKAQRKRNDLYIWLAKQLNIPVEECHFGYFDVKMLKRAYRILKRVDGKRMQYDENGKVYFP